jgi:diacylglycerol kinase (ATP)
LSSLQTRWTTAHGASPSSSARFPTSSISIIINPISGGVRPDAARARAELASAIVDRHGDPAEVFVTGHAGHARQLTKAAVARGARLVMAWGGDGTINEVASALAFGEVPLGIVPAGSGNGLARQLSVSPRAADAIRHAMSAEPRRIDVGELGDRLFVNVAGIGFDAHVARRFAESGRRRGLLTYVTTSARALTTYRPRHYTVTTPETCVDVRAILVTVANSAEFGNGARIAPGARVDDGWLELVVMEERTRFARLKTLWHLPRLFNGTVERAPGCSIRRVQQATIESDQPMAYHVDGEPMDGGTSLRVRIYPAALNVCV